MSDTARGAAGSATEPLIVANCSGFYGDRLSAMREMLDGGPVDVITGDYLYVYSASNRGGAAATSQYTLLGGL
ncbi:MAG TPA: acyclic terpene utilization AtuA family protein [Trueperaceae bacterium]|nr:acyclic terpene utilization AtuA family protein [Trueperaceae bacterium]